MANFTGRHLWLGRLQFTLEQAEAAGEYACGIHIPESGPLTPSLVDESLAAAGDLVPRTYPEYPVTDFVLHSWMLDPDLMACLEPESNLARFARRFRLLGGSEPGLHDALQQTLAATDIFLPSGDELYLFTTAQNEADAIAELLARGIKEILLKRGEQGASHYSAAGRLDAVPIAVREDDPTGAGDSFGGAYIALRLNGHDAASALRYANAAGARAVTRIGPMEGTSTLAELDALLIAHKNN